MTIHIILLTYNYWELLLWGDAGATVFIYFMYLEEMVKLGDNAKGGDYILVRYGRRICRGFS